jgi:hypothetical protein
MERWKNSCYFEDAAKKMADQYVVIYENVYMPCQQEILPLGTALRN